MKCTTCRGARQQGGNCHGLHALLLAAKGPCTGAEVELCAPAPYHGLLLVPPQLSSAAKQGGARWLLPQAEPGIAADALRIPPQRQLHPARRCVQAACAARRPLRRAPCRSGWRASGQQVQHVLVVVLQAAAVLCHDGRSDTRQLLQLLRKGARRCAGWACQHRGWWHSHACVPAGHRLCQPAATRPSASHSRACSARPPACRSSRSRPALK